MDSTTTGRQWRRAGPPPRSTPEQLAALQERLTRRRFEPPDPETLRMELPTPMQQARRWLLWRAEGAGKPRKVPYYVDGGRRGVTDTPEDAERLASLDAAIEAMSAGRWSGLGFALGPDGSGHHWQGVDLDGTDTRPELGGLVDLLPGYVERSPSGRGYHALGIGRAFEPLAANPSGVEAYASGRYFTVTGDAVNGDLEDLSPFVKATLAPLHKAAERPQERAAGAPDAPIPENARNATLTSLAGTMRRRGMSEAAILAALLAENAARCRPPLAEAEVRTIAASVSRYAPAELPEAAADDNPGLVAVDLSALRLATIHPPRFVIHPLVPRGHATLFGGHGGAGKSLIGLALCAHVACGRAWGGLEVERGRALYVSLEDPAELVRYRLRRIIDEYRLPIDDVRAGLTVLDGSDAGPLATEISEFGRHRLVWTAVHEALTRHAHGVDLLAVDNGSDAFDGNENSRRQVRQFVRGLAALVRPHDGAALLLVHIDKNAAKFGPNNNSYSGSTAWHNTARSRLALASDELVHEKLNLGKKLEAPILIEWSGGDVPMPGAPGKVADNPGDDEAVLACLRAASEAGANVPTAGTGPATTWHCLCAFPECPPALKDRRTGKARVQAALMRLVRAGRIRRETYRTKHRKEGERWALA